MNPRNSCLVEALESRVAPASVYFVGHPGITGDHEYTDVGTPFVKVGSGSDTVTNGAFAGATNTYYLKLNPGDVLELYTDGYHPWVSVTSGTVVAFFSDNGDGIVQSNELSGLALGKSVTAVVSGNVHGDILTNYNDTTGQLSPASLISNLQAITSLTVNGDITGSLLSGGPILKATISGNVTNIYTGTAANGYAYDLNGSDNDSGNVLSVTAAAKTVGPAISNVVVNSFTTMQAGDGGSGAVGGFITNITVTTDTDGLNIFAGNGGAGNAGATTGGAGGYIKTVYIQGASDSTSGDLIQIVAGNGGDAYNGGSGATGGAGGYVQSAYVGYQIDPVSHLLVQSNVLLNDYVSIQSGTGGQGKTGGVGGLISTVKVAVQAPDAINPLTNEIQVIAGNGGNVNVPVSGSIAGIGGSISSVSLQNFNTNLTTATTADIYVLAGSGGNAGALGNGANGGSISALTLLGFEANVQAGSGSNGLSVGGKGGFLQNIIFNQFQDVFSSNVTLNAGNGGNTSSVSTGTGTAGIGGSITTVRLTDVDLFNLNINAGNGGNSTTGMGGAGGLLTDVRVIDTDTVGNQGFVHIYSGNGGNGATKGGLGGTISKLTTFAENLNFYVFAGNGGAASNGSGGNGGSLNTVSLTGSGQYLSSDVFCVVGAGSGGNGSGASGTGGVGGSVQSLNASTPGSIYIYAGSGGNGAGGAAGSGGAITSTSAQSSNGSGLLYAGNAGIAGSKAGNGGGIISSNVLAAIDVTMLSGSGFAGGVGGSMTTVGFSGAAISQAPSGNILVQAGNGSALGTVAGSGGSITGLSGTLSSGQFATTQIIAGNGGSGTAKAGNGGSISNVSILNGGYAVAATPSTKTNIFTIQAGDAGNASSGTTGALGGNVNNVNVFGLAQGTLFRSVAAGDGGDALAAGGKGGLGGSVTGVHVAHNTSSNSDSDIGVRYGANYGYSTMGGVFAGVGGNGTTAGLNGNVINISADAIAAIVAGRSATPQLVTKVDMIYLNGLTSAVTDGFGGYTNLDTANFVGAYHGSNPTVAGASTYQATDGLIAAVTLTANRNFVPTYYLSSTGFVDPV